MSKLTVNDFSPLDPPIVGHTALTVIDPSPAPHRASWRAVKDELASVAAELSRLRAEKEVDRAIIAAQDARLAKAGADLEVEREARAVAERIASERAAEVQRLEARVRELEAETAETEAIFEARWQASLRAIERWQAATGQASQWPGHEELCAWLLGRVQELEPLAEAGRRMERAANLAAKLLARLHPGQHRWIEPCCADCRMSVGAPPLPDMQPCIFHDLEVALRAAGIGEGASHAS